jgi:hypothetical protein
MSQTLLSVRGISKHYAGKAVLVYEKFWEMLKAGQ